MTSTNYNAETMLKKSSNAEIIEFISMNISRADAKTKEDVCAKTKEDFCA